MVVSIPQETWEALNRDFKVQKGLDKEFSHDHAAWHASCREISAFMESAFLLDTPVNEEVMEDENHCILS